jgi:hypothetical protein
VNDRRIVVGVRDDGLRDKGDRALARVAERQVWLLAGQSSIPSGSEFLVCVPRGQVRVPVGTVL